MYIFFVMCTFFVYVYIPYYVAYSLYIHIVVIMDLFSVDVHILYYVCIPDV